MYLDSEGFDVVGPVGTTSEVAQIKLDLVPSLVQPHRHRADKRLHPSRALIVARPEPSSYALVIQNLHFESEVLLQLFIYTQHIYIHLYIHAYIYNYYYLKQLLTPSYIFITFFIIITRKGSLIPRVFFGSNGAVRNVVVTFVPIISNTLD